ncbi:hypothetical protein WJX73_000323 [Symbiochloris irregularis]|uniref:Uncharacterized protein n=1 Tax=Symbiochloris irregularis TaxID=706552 RepID=A0AAW1P135_9CHLO
MSGLLQGSFASGAVRCRGSRPVSSSFLQGQQVQCRVARQGRSTRKVTVMKVAAYDPIATPYAYALVDLATEKKLLNEIHTDVDTLRGLFEEDKSFRDFMYNPVAGNDKKRSLISKIQKEAGLQPYTANFLNLILDRGRIEALENIFEAFEAEYCKRTDTQVAVLRLSMEMQGV